MSIFANLKKLANHRKAAVRVTAGALAAVTLFASTACGTAQSANASSNTIAEPTNGKTVKVTVGVCAGPYGDMVEEVIAPLLKEKGYEVSTKVFNDYVQPDKALASGKIDANLMQHGNYLKKFSKDNNLDLVSLGQTPTLGLGIYSKKYKSISEIPDGATVAIANDGSNLARSLGVLQQQKLVTIKDGVDSTKASVSDITSNPKNLNIKPIDAAQLARSLDTVDVSLVPGNYSWAAGLDPNSALALEKQDDGVIEVFAIAGSNKDTHFAKTVKALLVSDEFKNAIAKSKFKDFGKPASWNA
ncbi:ABC transporter substrate-binding protein [Bifidobacterium sp. GSD1FS]|uniref:Lipoprotein n=1 Tax=Bifidobacterium canis TaxID=2610880 RepID=A0A7K1J268_9BIFI|nr:MetQ/NlpA family ABC transporter substrate-binding protein [Bifidobacterium canis]MUH58723.1 ABC transporter substrate-binding protein [Bifidobacterium canis]